MRYFLNPDYFAVVIFKRSLRLVNLKDEFQHIVIPILAVVGIQSLPGCFRTNVPEEA